MTTGTETLRFRVGLSGTYYDRAPAYRVLVNDEEYAAGTVSVPSGEVFYIDFDCSLAENAAHCLRIRLEDKRSTDTLVENGEIVRDQLLNIETVSIDDLELGTLVWSKSRYRLDQPQRFNDEIITELANCVNLGWNGTYELAFTVPFYFWLLENF